MSMGLHDSPQLSRVAAPASEDTKSRMTLQTAFGKHIMLDMRLCDYERLNSLENCFTILNTLPERIGMRKISAPHVFRYEAPNPIDSGITGLTIIAESHISLHTFPKKGYAFADIFSCKSFISDPVIKFFREYLEFQHFDVFTQNRGYGFAERFENLPSPDR
ncbi:s-adenosylmethionine decarboxylase proenzyme [Spirochaetota bacterium]|nr:s-adenosylmethionine decarboxylase proenzyme [Spirochaetota bacterium]